MNTFIKTLAFVAMTQTVLADPALNARLEKELGKMDGVIANQVRSNYRDGAERDRHIEFRILPDASRQLDAEVGIVEAHASFLSVSDRILIHEKWDDAVISAVPHEVWHGIYDDVGPDIGLIRRPGFAGPTDAEIAAYREELLARPSLQGARDSVAINMAAAQFKSLQQKIVSRVKQIVAGMRAYLEAFDDIDRHKKALGADFKADPIWIETQASFLKQSREFLRQKDVLQASSERLTAFAKRNEGEQTLEEFKEIAGEFDSILPSLRGFEEFAKAGYAFKKKVQRELFEQEKAQLERRIAEYEKKIAAARTSEERKQFEDILQIVKATLDDHLQFGQLVSGIDVGNVEEFLGSVGEMLGQISFSINEERMNEVLGNPNEVMARVVESLYAIYLGPARMNQFPLEERDLAFLARFTYNGKPMFRKGIEKYRIALDLLAAGKDPAWIRERLEYGTGYEWKGVKYSWPETKVTIQGEIPEVEK